MTNATPYGIDDFKRDIKDKSQQDKINAVKSEIVNIDLIPLSMGSSLSSVTYEKGYRESLDALLIEIENDRTYKYERNWNWYFNADNIPNQDAIFATKHFIDEKRKDIFESLDFLNLLFRQIDELKEGLNMPYDFLTGLKALPLEDMQKYILFGFILYWHGGYPVNNLNPKYNTTLKLIEIEFLAMYPGQLTPEKEFCATDIERQKLLLEAEAQVHAAISKFEITESRYFKKVQMDFADLPKYIVQKGIVRRFESEHLRSETQYQEWNQNLAGFLQTIPEDRIILTLRKGIEYGKKVYEYHLKNECTNPSGCPQNESWERRIALAEKMLQTILPEDSEEHLSQPDIPVKNKEFTTARQVLAIHYLLKHFNINPIDKPTAVTRFLQFLTGRELNAKRVQDTTIYKKVVSPFKLKDEELMKDLLFIKPFFQDLGLSEIVAAIEKELTSGS